MEKSEIDTNEERRKRWICEKLKSLPSGIRILDAGAGEQPYKKYCSHLNYVSQDFAKYVPNAVKSGLHMQKWEYGSLDIVSDITSIPEPDSSFDAILCSEVFEHIPDPLSAIREFYRLLKKDGKLILTAPFCSLTHFAPYHYYTGFNKYFYLEHLGNKGFEILEITTNGNYFEYLQQELNRVEIMSSLYKGSKISFIERKALGIVSRLLKNISKASEGSEEILNFGFHIFAQKK
jgi:ubiquinone/menaquinone biosynthesis C-methylase UbiE